MAYQTAAPNDRRLTSVQVAQIRKPENVIQAQSQTGRGEHEIHFVRPRLSEAMSERMMQLADRRVEMLLLIFVRIGDGGHFDLWMSVAGGLESESWSRSEGTTVFGWQEKVSKLVHHLHGLAGNWWITEHSTLSW